METPPSIDTASCDASNATIALLRSRAVRRSVGRVGPPAAATMQAFNHAFPPDHELLAMVLKPISGGRSTARTVRALLDKFRTFARVVTAPPISLLAVEGVKSRDVMALKTIEIAATNLLRQKVDEAPRLLGDKLKDYLKARLQHERVEVFVVLFLDSQQRVIADEELARGTIDSAEVYTREVIRRCLELDAKAIVLAHNHPRGQPYPSPADHDITNEIIRAAKLFRISVRDHIIVGEDAVFSFSKGPVL